MSWCVVVSVVVVGGFGVGWWMGCGVMAVMRVGLVVAVVMCGTVVAVTRVGVVVAVVMCGSGMAGGRGGGGGGGGCEGIGGAGWVGVWVGRGGVVVAWWLVGGGWVCVE